MNEAMVNTQGQQDAVHDRVYAIRDLLCDVQNLYSRMSALGIPLKVRLNCGKTDPWDTSRIHFDCEDGDVLSLLAGRCVRGVCLPFTSYSAPEPKEAKDADEA